MQVVLSYEPTERQRQFHLSREDEVLFGGAAGGGKSKAIVMEAALRALETPRMQIYLFRRTYPELRDTLIQEALRSLPHALFRFSSVTHDLTFPNGSCLHFRHCQNEQDRFIYAGVEMHALFIDEATHFTRTIYDFLKTRLRANVSMGIRPIVRLTANPGGVGHSWVKQYFIDVAPPFTVYKSFVQVLDTQMVRTRLYIPSLPTDNPYLSKEYIAELSQKPRALRDALLLGKWDAFEGQAFSEFANNFSHYQDGCFTHVIAPFSIPSSWPRYRSFDFGYAKPFSVGWWALDPDGVCYRYREWYGAKGDNEGIRLSPRDIALGIADREREEKGPIFGIADPSIWDASRGESIAEQMEKEGIYFEPGDNARLAGKAQLHSRLRFDEKGKAQLYVFSSCLAFIRTIGALGYSPRNVEDVDTTQEDHVYDETRYFLMARPLGRKEKVKKRRVYDPLSD